jgi:hypothetical protein
MRIATTVFVFAVIFAGCALFDSGRNWRSGKFEVLWIDLRSDIHLAYRLDSSTSISIVDGCVFAPAANEQYVAVQQRPLGSSETLFYVVEKGNYDPSRKTGNSLIGPLSEPMFRALGKNLSLPLPEPVIPLAACNTAA